MSATTSDFLGEGTGQGVLSPFQTPEERAQDEEARIAYANQQAGLTTANNNVDYYRRRQAEDAWRRENPDQSEYQSEAERRRMLKNRHSLGGALIRDPLTLGILAAPAAITGAGLLAAPAAAAGGTMAGGTAAPAITTGGAMTAPTLAAPTAIGGATAASTGTAAAAGGLSAGQVISGLQAATAGGMLLNDVFGGHGDEAKLRRKQAQLAEEARQRQSSMHQQQMNSLGQQLLAFNPQNQLMAQMFGPQAAFSPEQFAAMGKDPAAVDPSLVNYQGGDPAIQKKVQEQVQRLQADQARQASIKQGMTPLPPAATPLQPTQVQQQRRF